VTIHAAGCVIIGGAASAFSWLWGYYLGRCDTEDSIILHTLSWGGPKTGGEFGAGSVYARLRALERKGLIHSWEGNATPSRSGRQRRYYALTEKGFRKVGYVQW
jgi:hypothetical protein